MGQAHLHLLRRRGRLGRPAWSRPPRRRSTGRIRASSPPSWSAARSADDDQVQDDEHAQRPVELGSHAVASSWYRIAGVADRSGRRRARRALGAPGVPSPRRRGRPPRHRWRQPHHRTPCPPTCTPTRITGSGSQPISRATASSSPTLPGAGPAPGPPAAAIASPRRTLTVPGGRAEADRVDQEQGPRAVHVAQQARGPASRRPRAGSPAGIAARVVARQAAAAPPRRGRRPRRHGAGRCPPP